MDVKSQIEKYKGILRFILSFYGIELGEGFYKEYGGVSIVKLKTIFSKMLENFALHYGI